MQWKIVLAAACMGTIAGACIVATMVGNPPGWLWLLPVIGILLSAIVLPRRTTMKERRVRGGPMVRRTLTRLVFLVFLAVLGGWFKLGRAGWSLPEVRVITVAGIAATIIVATYCGNLMVRWTHRAPVYRIVGRGYRIVVALDPGGYRIRCRARWRVHHREHVRRNRLAAIARAVAHAQAHSH